VGDIGKYRGRSGPKDGGFRIFAREGDDVRTLVHAGGDRTVIVGVLTGSYRGGVDGCWLTVEFVNGGLKMHGDGARVVEAEGHKKGGSTARRR
jgi:hypothetical protein